ncbi:MAG: hypothetical protein WCL30_02405 [Pseudomonadota bacterium]
MSYIDEISAMRERISAGKARGVALWENCTPSADDDLATFSEPEKVILGRYTANVKGRQSYE